MSYNIFDTRSDNMKVQKLVPRGYCHGVVHAIKTIKALDTDKLKQPVTFLGMLIHNKLVNEHFKNKGVKILHDPTKTRLELLDMIDTGTVIFTAHGVSKNVIDKAKAKGLDIINTTCSDVEKSFDTISSYLSQDYKVLYIGKKGHPESEAACQIDESVRLIESVDDIVNITESFNKIAVTNQTTMSLYDVYSIYEAAQAKFPNIVLIDDICNATKSRQEAVINQDKDNQLCYVVGDHLSNNTLKLSEISIQKAGIPAKVIESINDIKIADIINLDKVSVTSGASTPTRVTKEVINFLSQFDKFDTTTHNITSNITINNVI